MNRNRMRAQDAISMADAMDLPDGAYFAMIGDLMGGDYMDGIHAAMDDEGCEPPRHGPGRRMGPGSPYATKTDRNRARGQRRKARKLAARTPA